MPTPFELSGTIQRGHGGRGPVTEPSTQAQMPVHYAGVRPETYVPIEIFRPQPRASCP